MKQILLLVLLTIAALIGGLYYYVGGYKNIAMETTEAGPFKTVSKPHLGAYFKIVPVIEEVEKWAQANGESCKLSFGEYIDKPGEITEDRLRSNGGCIVEKEWMQGLPEGYTYRELPRRLYVTATFDGAPSIGPYKVYPRVFTYVDENKLSMDGPIIEMYEVLPDNKLLTRYYFPVVRK